MDSVPGAKCQLKLPESDGFQEAYLFGSSIWKGCTKPDGVEIEILNCPNRGLIHEDGLLLTGLDNVMVNVKRVKIGGRMRLASALDQISEQVDIQYTIEEKHATDLIRKSWEAILSIEVDDDTDFFAAGAGSMDVVRY